MRSARGRYLGPWPCTGPVDPLDANSSAARSLAVAGQVSDPIAAVRSTVPLVSVEGGIAAELVVSAGYWVQTIGKWRGR